MPKPKPKSRPRTPPPPPTLEHGSVRLADWIMAHGVTDPKKAPAVDLTALGNVPIFVCDDVAASLEEKQEMMHEDLPQFHSLAPPFRSFWMETRAPEWYRKGADSEIFYAWGCAFVADRIKDAPPIPFRRESANRRLLTENPNGWMVFMNLFVQMDRRGRAIGPIAGMGMLLDERGRFLPGSRFLLAYPEGNLTATDLLEHDTTVRGVVECTPQLFYPFFQTLALLNCKNVTTRDVVPAPKFNRAYQKRNPDAPPLTTYKTLVVNAPGSSTPSVRNRKDPDRHIAQHVRRGCFRTYTDERPLLGKHVGTFWFQSTVVGDPSHGSVVKDYLPTSSRPTARKKS